VQQQHSVVEESPPRREPTTNAAATRSCIDSGMSIVGNIECDGPAQVSGEIKGELRASDLLIGDGAQVEGSVIAQDVTICGRVKGTIRAVRVKLQDGGAVELQRAIRTTLQRMDQIGEKMTGLIPDLMRTSCGPHRCTTYPLYPP
jgi:cytoskeletal protein CcmA (bactofilin family)